MADEAVHRTIAVSANFTAEPVQVALGYWLAALDLPYRILFAPFDQIFQQLLDPASLLGANREGINVVLLRLEAWQNGGHDGRADATGHQDDVSQLGEIVDEFAQVLTSAAERSSQPYLVITCPTSPDKLKDQRRSAEFVRAERELTARVEQLDGVHLVTSDQLLKLYPVANYQDPHSDALGQVPYTPALFAALGTTIARRLHALQNRPPKVIAVDCDGTLWRGVCAEDGARGVEIDPPRRALQQFLKSQHDSGALLCLCSKNNEQDVLDVFDAHPEMPLRREDFVAWRMNWQPKSANLKSLADELKLALEHFALFDDSPLECAEVNANTPSVLTVLLPQDIVTLPRFLAHHWAFDRIRVTDVDRQRTRLYRQNRQRERFRKESPSLDEFLNRLNLSVEIGPASLDDAARVSQLTQRTNQFNCTTRRYSEAEIRDICRSSGGDCLIVRASDRFGDYGLVGVLIVGQRTDYLETDTFLLSCRALGRGIEHQMLARLGAIAQQRRVGRIVIRYLPTVRNQPAFDFLLSAMDRQDQPHARETDFQISAERAAATQYRPLDANAATEADRQHIPRNDSHQPLADSNLGSKSQTADRFVQLERIAAELYDVDRLLHAIEADRRRPRNGLSVPYAAPRNACQSKLAEIWSHVLGVDCVGIDDNFFELGGNSLSMTQIVARVNEKFQVGLELPSLFQTPTISKLAATVQALIADHEPRGRLRDILRYVTSLSEKDAKRMLESHAEPLQVSLADAATGGSVAAVESASIYSGASTRTAAVGAELSLVDDRPRESVETSGSMCFGESSATATGHLGDRPSPIEMPNQHADAVKTNGSSVHRLSDESRPADSSRRDSPAAITKVALLTCNRPKTLERGLASYLANFRKYERVPDVIVVDDAPTPDASHRNRQLLAALGPDFSGRLSFAGRQEKSRFADLLVEHGDVPRDVVQFALFGSDDGLPTYGANSNAMLLASLGRTALCVDDDTVCRISTTPEPGGGIAFTSDCDPAGYWVFPDRDECLAAAPPVETDLLGLHEKLLGKQFAEIVGQFRTGTPLELRSSNPEFLERVKSGRGRVAITSTGLAGDCGWGAPFGFWNVPMGHLLQGGSSHARLVRSESDYREACASREILRVVDRLTVSDMTFSMGTFLGLDNRRLLPPFMPVQRGEDLIFGATVWKCMDDAFFGHLPWTLLHAPAELRRFSPGEIFRTASGVDTARVMLECIQSRQFDDSLGAEQQLQILGRHLVELGSRTDREFQQFLQERLNRSAERFIDLMQSRLDAEHHSPAYWAADVSKYADLLGKHCQNEDYGIPLDLVAGRSLEEARSLTRQLVRQFGRLLEWWPQIVNAAASLHDKGHQLAQHV